MAVNERQLGLDFALSSNKSLQVTFDPPPTFAAAKAGVASNAPELRRWAPNSGDQ